MQKAIRGLVVSAIVCGGSALARADVYSDGKLTVDWSLRDNAFAGKLTLGDQQYPTTAHLAGEEISGEFQVNGSVFNYTARLQNDTLTLSSGGKTYTLQRKDAPANPLADASGAAPPDAAHPAPTPQTPQAGTSSLPGYSVRQRTDAGEALVATKPAASNVRDALSDLVPDLTRLLDAQVSLASAVEDEKSPGSGFLNFTGTKQGRPVRGVASCQLDGSQTRIKIVYCATTASPQEWQKLNADQNAVTDAAAKVALQEYRMSDGTGTLGLPEGWTTRATSMLDPIEVDGPGNAKLNINASLIVYSPNGSMMDIYKRGVQMSQQFHLPLPTKPPGLYADFAAPSDAIKTLIPQINEICRKSNLPTVESDQIISVVPTQSQLPNGRAQLMEDTAYQVKPDGTRTLMHGVGRYESAMLMGSKDWMIQITSMVAPDDSFAKAQPTMLAILNSGKIDQQQCDRISQQRAQQSQQQLAQSSADIRARQNAQFEAGQAAHRQQMASYDRYNHNWAVNQNLKARSNDNFIEYIGGTRDVIDTTTGQRGTYDLNDANAVAQTLNDAASDPGRFKAIPLRDLNHPINGR